MTVDYAVEAQERSILDMFDSETQFESLPWETLVVNVTPELAEKWLHASNTVNRTLDKGHVSRLAQALRDGTYQTTPQGISFSPSGDLLDGHHRLSAVSLSRVSQQMVVFYGVDPKTFIVFDSISKIRSVSDIVKTAGISATNSAPVAAAYKLLRSWNEGRANSGNAAQISASQLMAIHEEHPGVVDVIIASKKAGTASGVNATAIAVAMYLLGSTRPDIDSSPFFDGLESGANLSADSPILALRNFAIKKRAAKSAVSQSDWLKAVLKSWVAWADNKPTSFLRMTDGEKNPDILKAGGAVVKPRAAGQGILLADLLAAGLVVPNARLVSTDPLHREIAFVRGDGTIECGVRSFANPIEAANFVRGGTTNGWIFWAVAGADRNVPLSEIRAAYIESKGL
ncbi:MAG TPA: hypothetical protein VF885_05370 [Arthrobacter sp.]